MAKKGYLGIDESNRGSFPEFYVGVYSKDVEDTYKKQGLMKIRRRRPIDPNHILGERDFNSIFIPKKFKKEFGDNGIQVVVLSEFIKNFEDISCIFIDGRIRSSVIEGVEKIIYPIKTPRIDPVPHGDLLIPLINMADAVAYSLYKSYKRFKKYPDKLISPKLEDYVGLDQYL